MHYEATEQSEILRLFTLGDIRKTLYGIVNILLHTYNIHTRILSEAVKLIITYADSKCSARGLVARCEVPALTQLLRQIVHLRAVVAKRTV